MESGRKGNKLVDYWGILILLRALIDANVITEEEAKRLNERISKDMGFLSPWSIP